MLKLVIICLSVIDGFALSVMHNATNTTLMVNADLVSPIEASILQGCSPLTSYYYTVNSSSPSTELSADITLPCECSTLGNQMSSSSVADGFTC